MAVRASREIVEALYLYDGPKARVTRFVVEALEPVVTRSPTTVTGAGVTQEVVEALYLDDATDVRLTRMVIEALYLDTSQSGATPGAGPQVGTSFGYAV